jgi:hypothetical protein
MTRRSAVVMGGLVLVVLVLLGTTLGLLASHGSGKQGSPQGASGTTGGATGGHTGSGASGSASTSPSGSASAPSSTSSGASGTSGSASASSSASAPAGGGVPSGFRTYSDSGNHFSIALPGSFQQGGNPKTGPQGQSVIFTGPGGDSYIEVDWNMMPGMGAQQGLQQLASQSEGGFPGYQQLRLSGSTFKSGWDSADWEFKYSNAPVLKHAVTRHFVVDKSHSFNITWITLDKDWSSQASRQILSTLYSSFKFTS